MSSNHPQKSQKMIGEYSVGELLGKGAMGCVYKGINLNTGKLVAIKTVPFLFRFRLRT
jgi:serine/threonine protein kinase